MKLPQSTYRFLLTFLALVVVSTITTTRASAHCDTLNGPVARAARQALKSGDFGPIRIWVGQQQEDELKQRFQQCLTVRQAGSDAADLADMYFIETAVRLHREAEGMPYTGLKPAGPMPPDIQAAEQALDTGELQPLTDLMHQHLDRQLSRWFRRAKEARQNRNESVTAGRQWVDAYVKYIVYVHGLYTTIEAGPEHGVGER